MLSIAPWGALCCRLAARARAVPRVPWHGWSTRSGGAAAVRRLPFARRLCSRAGREFGLACVHRQRISCASARIACCDGMHNVSTMQIECCLSSSRKVLSMAGAARVRPMSYVGMSLRAARIDQPWLPQVMPQAQQVYV